MHPSPARLYGRLAESERLHRLVAGTAQGGGSLLVRGEAGIGKSALLEQAARTAEAAGLRVLSTTALESEAHLPFAGLHQLIYPLRRHVRELPPSQRDALESALGITDAPVPDLSSVALAALDLLARAATHAPLLLVVEDVHWLDRASAEALTFVARRLDPEPVTLLMALRDGYPAYLDTAGTAQITLHPLPPDDAAALLDSTAPLLDRTTRHRLLLEAAGNPLALTELHLTHQEMNAHRTPASPWLPLTQRLKVAFGARLHALPARTRTLLVVAACDDSGALTELLPAASLVRGEAVTGRDLSPAVEARIVEIRDGALRFRHPLMRSAIHQGSTLAARQVVHAALAAGLAPMSDRRVWHEAAAAPGADEAVASRLETVADRAEGRGGATVSVTALERAAGLSSRPALRAERLLRAARQAVDLGRPDLVVQLLAEAAPLAATPQQSARAEWIRTTLGDGMREAGHGVSALVGLARTVAAEGDTDLAVRILWSAALRCFWTEPGSRARQSTVAFADTLGLGDTDPRLLAIMACAEPLRLGGRVLAHLAAAAAGTGGSAQAEQFVGSAALLVGSFGIAQKSSETSASGLRAEGRLGLLARALGTQAWSGVQLADLTSAIPVAEEASRLATETGQPFVHALGLATEARTAALRGRFERAHELAAAAERVALPVGARPVLATVQLARGLAAIGAGRFGEACAQLRRMHDPSDPAYHLALRCYALVELADAAAHSDQADAVRVIIDEMEAAADTTPSPALHSGLRYARAVLADDATAEDHFLAALRTASGAWPFDLARTQLAYGEWLRRRRRIVDSRRQLRAARESFDTLGTIPWSERARQELLATGETSRHRRPHARDHLTPQELRIARMAAEGLTNRDIGQRLLLSPRTISTHLHRIFPKLGVTSRAELRTALGPPADPDEMPETVM